MPEGSGIKRFFLRNWEKIVLWAILVGLFYLLRPFFLLIFETFLITYITKGAVQWLVRRWRWSHRWTTVGVFLVFVGLLGTIGAFVGPKLVVESHRILVDFAGDGERQMQGRISAALDQMVLAVAGKERGQAFIDSREYDHVIEFVQGETTRIVKASFPDLLDALLHLLKFAWEFIISLLLAVLFSFVLVLDWERIAEATRQLEHSRIRTFYIGAAPHLQAFAEVLGKAFRAQAIIATCNTLLTATGLWLLGVPHLALLSIVVFFCGFIPILGTFLSSAPILLFGLQAGGLPLVAKLIVLIAVVHAFEAYLLNPKITADVLHMHPVLVLVLLLIGERFFGIWGMVVGVPIGYYLLSVLATPEGHPADAESPSHPHP